MRFDVITCLPNLFNGFLNDSILKRAQEKLLIDINVHDLRDFTSNKYKQIDDYAFGGGAGMVLMVEPIARCIDKLKEERDYDNIFYLSPDGMTFDQKMANQLSLAGNIILLCGHYKGVDERVREHFAIYDSLPRYKRMVELGGTKSAAEVCIVGDEAELRRRLGAFSDAGLTDLLAAPFAAGDDRSASWTRTVECLAAIAGTR